MSTLFDRKEEPPLRLAVSALLPTDRAALHRQLAERFDRMLAQGLLDEVSALKRRGDLTPDLPSIRSVGYRQAWAHLDGATDAAQFRAAAIAATRQLAKRQMTWLRSLPIEQQIDPQRENALARLQDRIAQLWPHVRAM
jgi:tRNA dimethylallyltransferase